MLKYAQPTPLKRRKKKGPYFPDRLNQDLVKIDNRLYTFFNSTQPNPLSGQPSVGGGGSSVLFDSEAEDYLDGIGGSAGAPSVDYEDSDPETPVPTHQLRRRVVGNEVRAFGATPPEPESESGLGRRGGGLFQELRDEYHSTPLRNEINDLMERTREAAAELERFEQTTSDTGRQMDNILRSPQMITRGQRQYPIPAGREVTGYRDQTQEATDEVTHI